VKLAGRGWGKVTERRRLRKLLDRWRAAMAAAGEHEQARLDDAAILVGHVQLVEAEARRRGRNHTAEELQEAALWAIRAVADAPRESAKTSENSR
jgi:hypothetical protein